jgi:hypothetical protein
MDMYVLVHLNEVAHKSRSQKRRCGPSRPHRKLVHVATLQNPASISLNRSHEEEDVATHAGVV